MVMRYYVIGSAAIILVRAQFNIPIPFGNIGLKTNDNGNLEITSNEGFNLFGYGGRRNLKVVTGNGTFQIESECRITKLRFIKLL
ncbi:hypothetical protein OESDEN_16167 [Oesophagostomum dentatum]|uniref:Uncharacterized protein n=1 Tax=Oesophagostomum dentatum TaxID=61180 RepID=A0A0B1SFQ8_OESDE|nr:hypothetical protein OESDEN_16167 [Oesophagostomum dentatum]